MGLTKKQIIMLAVLMSGSFLTILNQTLVNPALPAIMRDMAVDAPTVQWLATGFTLVNAIMIPISAYLTDRFDTRSLYIVAVSTFAAGSLLCGWGPSFGVLLAGRLTQALGAGVLMPMVMTVLLLSFPTERRGTAMGWFGIIIGAAPAIGPTLAGVIIDSYDWHIMFFGVAALAGLIVICSFAFLDKVKEGSKDVPPLDKPSVILSTLGFGSVLYSFSCVGSYGFSWIAGVFLLLGAVTLVFFFRRQLRLERPMLQVRVLKSRRFLVGTAIPMVVQAAIMGNAVLIPIFVQNLCGQSATISGLVMLPGAIIMALMGPVAGGIFDKHGPRAMSICGTALLTATTVVLCFVNTASSMIFLGAIIALRNLGMSVINMPINTWGMNSLDNKLINHGNAVNNTFRQMAGSLGTALVVSTYSLVGGALSGPLGNATQASVYGINAAFALQTLLCLAAFVMAIVLVKDRPQDRLQADPSGVRRSTVERLMHRDVYSLPQDASVADAVRLFTSKGISAAPIVDVNGEPVGFISDGDVIRAMGQRGSSFIDPIAMIIVNANSDGDLIQRFDKIMNRPASSIATAGVISVDVHESIEEICRVLGGNHLKKVPVTDNGRIVGVINRSDITMESMRMYLERAEGITSSKEQQR